MFVEDEREDFYLLQSHKVSEMTHHDIFHFVCVETEHGSLSGRYITSFLFEFLVVQLLVLGNLILPRHHVVPHDRKIRY